MAGGARLFIALLGLAGFGGAVTWFGVLAPESDRLPAADTAPLQPAPVKEAAISPPIPEQRPTPAAPAAEPPKPVGELQKPPGGAEDPARMASAGPAGQPAGPAEPLAPSFDVVRVEPSGESVIAGRGPPGAMVEMLRNGEVHARTIADHSGLFALVPPVLAPGAHDVVLNAIAPNGAHSRSRESVTIEITKDRKEKPLVALTAPERPTVVLSAPEPARRRPEETAETPAMTARAEPPGEVPKPGPPPPRGPVKVASVEAEEGGRLFVSGNGPAGATVRLYLNETFVAPGSIGTDGRVAFAIGRGIKPGSYRVRLDEVDPVSGQVKSRAEVVFPVPVTIDVPLPPAAPPYITEGRPSSERAETDRSASELRMGSRPGAAPGAEGRPPPGSDAEGPGMAPERQAAAPPLLPGPQGSGIRPPASTGTDAGSGSAPERQAAARPPAPRRDLDALTVVIPEVNTAIVSRGDNLWSISRRIYGQGMRYTEIYGANQEQIRDPKLIYPGQAFVLPPAQPSEAR